MLYYTIKFWYIMLYQLNNICYTITILYYIVIRCIVLYYYYMILYYIII
jgi:hypothetical protein